MKNRRLKDSFANAFRGIYQAFKTERNVKLHVVAATLAIVMGVILNFNYSEWIIVIMTIVMVISIELLNTAVEYAVDMVCGDNYNEIAKYAKDIAAGATLIAAIGSILVGSILYIPKIIELI